METNNSNNNNQPGQTSQTDSGLNPQQDRNQAGSDNMGNRQQTSGDPALSESDSDNPNRNSSTSGNAGRQDDVSGRGYQTDNKDEQRQDWNSDDMGTGEGSGQGEERRTSEQIGTQFTGGDTQGFDADNRSEDKNQQGSESYGADTDHTADRI